MKSQYLSTRSDDVEILLGPHGGSGDPPALIAGGPSASTLGGIAGAVVAADFANTANLVVGTIAAMPDPTGEATLSALPDIPGFPESDHSDSEVDVVSIQSSPGKSQPADPAQHTAPL